MVKFGKWLLPVLIISSVGYIFFFATLTTEQKSIVTMVMLAIVLLERGFKLFNPTKNLGSMLLRVSPIQSISRFFRVLAAFFLFFSAVTLYNTFSIQVNLLGTTCAALLGISFALYFLILSEKTIELRETGINDMFSFIKWENIESYSWTGPYNQTLTIKLKNKVNRAWIIPPKDGVAVNRILAEKVLGWQEQVSPQS